MTQPAIGFIGFGEAGFTIASGLRSAGITDIEAYDIAWETADRGPLISERAGRAGVKLLKSSAALAGRVDILFSAVTSSAALEAVEQTAMFLTTGHLYVDLNSVSPALKRRIGSIVSGRGAKFVEAAVMAPVAPYGHAVPMLLGGPHAETFAGLMRPFGMRLDPLAGELGTAAAVKMCRSIVVKGLEAILCECVLGASAYGAEAQVFASLQESFPGIEWRTLADYAMNRLVVHGERRAREMEEVAETLRAMGIDPIMAEATARRQDWSARQGLRERFAPEGPQTYAEVLAALRT
jgi:3-hydroxyisobutyrate dehydrogenase-like beta-hydroxyacid dehydrogenase